MVNVSDGLKKNVCSSVPVEDPSNVKGHVADSILRVFCILTDFLSTCSVSDREKLLKSQSIIVDLSAYSFSSIIICFPYFAALRLGTSAFRIVYHFDELPTSSFRNDPHYPCNILFPEIYFIQY